MQGNEITVFLSGGDFAGGRVPVPQDVTDFYVYSGDMINVYHVELSDGEETANASFLLDELATNFTIPQDAWAIELIWDTDNTRWVAA